MEERKFFEAEMVNNGATGDDHKAIFEARELDYFSNRFWNVVVSEGRVLVRSSLVDALCLGTAESQLYKLGRTKLWTLTDAMIDEAQEMINYPRRSQREQNVADRNQKALDWLTALYLGL